MRAGSALVLAIAALGFASAAQAQPDARGTSAGVVLQESTQGSSAASKAGTMTGGNAAVNYPTADSAFASSDGIPIPDSANQSPGHDRLTHLRQDSALLTADGDIRVSRMLGTGVFTPTGDRLGTVRDVMLSGPGEPQLVLEANGRTVEVPWSKLVLGLPGTMLHANVVLPGVTQHILEELPEIDLERARGHG